MKKYFLDLFEYNNWANDKIILTLQKIHHTINNTDHLKILSHIISSQDAWLEKVKGKSAYQIFLWEEYSIQEIEILSMKSHKEWIKFISKMNEKQFGEICIYKNSKGIEQSRYYQDILQHVVIHSSYHRGQINQLLRMNNIEPAKIDFIYYC